MRNATDELRNTSQTRHVMPGQIWSDGNWRREVLNRAVDHVSYWTCWVWDIRDDTKPKMLAQFDLDAFEYPGMILKCGPAD